MNPASELLRDVFGEAGRHARTAIGVAALPLDPPVWAKVAELWNAVRTVDPDSRLTRGIVASTAPVAVDAAPSGQ